MATLAVVLGIVSAVSLGALFFVVGYILGASRSQDPIAFPIPEISLPGRKKKGRHKPKAMNEEQLAEREKQDQAKREIAMNDQEAPDFG